MDAYIGVVYYWLAETSEGFTYTSILIDRGLIGTRKEKMTSENNHHCNLIDRFSLIERVLMRTGWFGFMAVGTYGIYRQDPLWAWLYITYGILGFALVVLPGLCAHCPYPSKHSTCLFLPPQLLNRFYPYRGPQMSLGGKAATIATMAGMVIMPHFWLVNDVPLLVLFWLLGLPTVAAFPTHYCKQCRHFGCPMNKAGSQAI